MTNQTQVAINSIKAIIEEEIINSIKAIIEEEIKKDSPDWEHIKRLASNGEIAENHPINQSQEELS